MPEDHKLPRIFFKKRAILDFDRIYKAVFMWLQDRKYQDIQEDLYKLKIEEGEWEIHGEKRISDYVKYRVDVKFQTWEMRDVEVVKNERKVKLTSTKLKVYVDGKVITDYQDILGGSKFKEWLRTFYERYIIKKKIEDVWQYEVYKDMYAIRDLLIKLLEMETHR